MSHASSPRREWYYADSKGVHGPLALDEIAEVIGRGVVTKDTKVWRDNGMPSWRTIVEVPAFEGFFAKGQSRPSVSEDAGSVQPSSDHSPARDMPALRADETASTTASGRARADRLLADAIDAHEKEKSKSHVYKLYKDAATAYLNYLETGRHFQRVPPKDQMEVQATVESVLQIIKPWEKRLEAEESLRMARGHDMHDSSGWALASDPPHPNTTSPPTNGITREGAISHYKNAARLYLELLENHPDLEDSAEVLAQVTDILGKVRVLEGQSPDSSADGGTQIDDIAAELDELAVLDFPTVPSSLPVPLKGRRAPSQARDHASSSLPQNEGVGPSLRNVRQTPSTGQGPSVHQPYWTNNACLTDEELQILRATSRILDRVYLPWMPSDATELVATTSSSGLSGMFVDPDGDLALSEKQKKRFHRWMRPKELVNKSNGQSPCMIHHVDAYDIVQTLVSDCSFVSSLAVAANYEKRFKRGLITTAIFPQRNGYPVLNPAGKYYVRLFINGVARRVTVDDRLPTDAQGNLLCSFSRSRNEYWVSIIEKAFLKIGGSYDFPGSTSEVDLHQLTGWLPESVHMHKEETFDPDKFWIRMRDGHLLGQCLMTISTGEMPEARAKALGLVPTHAYAVLDVKEVPALGLRMIQLKNPWSELSWKGPYSAQDKQRWTTSLCQALRYDPKQASQHDNGVFWINWESAREVFGTIHFNWNPHLFSNHFAAHAHWPLLRGQLAAKRDLYTMGHCPQYALTVYHREGEAKQSISVWLHLSKHVTNPLAPNEDFLALWVFKQTPGDSGKRVYYPDNALIKGVYVNNTHRLIRLDVPVAAKGAGQGNAASHFVAVITQYERKNPITYTFRAHSGARIEMKGLPLQPYKFHHPRLVGEWPEVSRGKVTYTLTIQVATELLIQVDGPKQFGVNLKLLEEKGTPVNVSNLYRPGYYYLRQQVKAGRYVLVISNYENSAGPFFLHVSSSKCDPAIDVRS
mmetsp:Transcript_8004/g.29593  ORF Transcript_8004/g.29593 Transcript_8004/m.29593 type:complete len:979 (-) Transcript_8004:1377-4313(-)